MRVSGPPLSVLMPVRNGQATIQLAIDDILRGLDHDDELVIVDDGSDDGTVSIVRRASSHDDRVKLIATRQQGIAAALNLGLVHVSNPWVARADSDDRYPVARFGKQRKHCRSGVSLVSADYVAVMGRRRLGVIPTALTTPFVLLSLVHPQRVPHPGVILHRDAVIAAGGYQEADFPAEDLGLWLRLAHEGDLVGSSVVGVEWSMRPGSVTHTAQEAQRARRRSLLAWHRSVFQRQIVSVEALQNELVAYTSIPFGERRRVLLARDLYSLAPLIGSGAFRACLEELQRHWTGTLSAVAGLALDRSRRQSARRLITRQTSVG